MKKTDLNGQWSLKIIGKDSELTGKNGIPVSVPGSVYGALLDNKIIEDPYYRDNELKVLPIMDNDFEFVRSFTVTEEMLTSDGLILRFDGIDTLADIFVNGTLIGTAENMHRVYEYDLLDFEECLKMGEDANELKVFIKSPTKYIKEENAKVYTGGSGECMEGFPHIRKAHCMFGWDWGPRIPDAGIFRDVSLLEISKARIDGVYISQEHIWDEKYVRRAGTHDIPPSEVKLSFDVDVELFASSGMTGYADSEDDTNVTIVVYAPNGEVYAQDEDLYSVTITEPELWWPNGMGEHPLYNVEVVLSDGNRKILDTWNGRIGLRTLTVNTDDDEYGQCFAHEINGVKVFAMGADYIPEDNILSRTNKERTQKLLTEAVWANHNCIRVWGGGYYPDDYFYDLCDEMGLIVWQDFMFACASYELDDEFERNITEEVRTNLKRIRNHACLGILSGNNEMETQTLDGCWKTSIKQKADYTKIFEYIIPKIVKEEAPNIFYWPSSPSSGGSFDNPWDENRGDAHYWDVWHGEKPFTDYRKYFYRYLSEFGFQSFPNIRTIESFTLPEDRNIFSYVMEMHQRNKSANGKIMKYISETYLYPTKFETLVYASQLLQADAIRYGVEHFRRNRGRCMGAVVWQLNDIWPVASWSSIDYYGRRKALHYAEKRMFAPIMISCEETGELTERPYVIDEPSNVGGGDNIVGNGTVGAFKMGARLHVANESRIPVLGLVHWSLRRPDSSVVMEDSVEVKVGALDGTWLDYISFDGFDSHEVHLEYSVKVFGRVVSSNTVLFTPPKHYEFKDPKLEVERQGNKLIVTAENYAKGVYIESVYAEGSPDVVLSDNYFDMEKGSVEIEIVEGDAETFKVMSVYDIR